MWLKLHVEGDLIKVSWGADRGPYPKTYHIGADSLRAASNAIKRHLEQFNAWDKNPAAVNLQDVLRGLAHSGRQLRFVLFNPVPSADGNLAQIDDLIQWYELKRQKDKRLFVITSPYLHVPWALVNESNAGALPATPIDMSHFDGLWCRTFELSTVFFGHTVPEDQLNRRANDFYLISALNRQIFGTTLALIQRQDRMLAEDIERLLKTPLGCAFTREACVANIEKAASKDTIFHFFGHGRQGSLDLGHEQIDPNEFRQLLDVLSKRRDEGGSESYSLLILNACESVLGSGDYTLRAASAIPGICGLIAAEAEVPAQFALRFSYRFLDLLVRGRRSIGQTMRELHSDRDMWPLILLYGCYAEPDYRFS